MRPPTLGDVADDLPGHAQAAGGLVSRHVLDHHAEEWRQHPRAAKGSWAGGYKTAWTWLHNLRRAMVRPGRDRLSGRIEVDETYLGGLEEGARRRQTDRKALIVSSLQRRRTWGGTNPHAAHPECLRRKSGALCPGGHRTGTVDTDGWLGYRPVETAGYDHQVTFLRGKGESPSVLMPRVDRVVSLLKRWLMGTHQGAVTPEYPDYYLNEFTFRFNRRRSRNRRKLFYRLAQQAVAIDPVPYKSVIKCAAGQRVRPQPVGSYPKVAPRIRRFYSRCPIEL
jgi:hypothetical protein